MELGVTFRNSISSRCFASDRPWNARSAPLVTFPNILAKCAAFLIAIRHIASFGFWACLVGFFYKLNVPGITRVRLLARRVDAVARREPGGSVRRHCRHLRDEA